MRDIGASSVGVAAAAAVVVASVIGVSSHVAAVEDEDEAAAAGAVRFSLARAATEDAAVISDAAGCG